MHSHIAYLEEENSAIRKKIIEMEDKNMKCASQQLSQYNRAESCSKQSVSNMHSHIAYLEEENSAIRKKITEMEDKNMKCASQQLSQYNKAENNVQEMRVWTDSQVHDDQHDLRATREQSENRIKDLHIQLQACEEKIRMAQEDLNRLRDYRDREHSLKVLEATELERQIQVLNETHQDQAADVETLVNHENQKLLDSQQTVTKSILQDIVEEQLESAPLSLKRLCLQNQKLKRDIYAYQKSIAEIQNEVLVLLKEGDSFCKLWNNETDKLCKDLLHVKPPICTPDEDVVLNIPFNKQMQI